ncbi:MAG TPA: NAD(P)/FAD-dependent oxidoreductase [Vicinamibacterales bacterium]|nr:NAD(P)/FAD-dependent oxidoreductase [Vicinamibacterales bacterium]
MTDVVVIGGGLNGLVAATLLARQKLQVILLEQRPVVGGGAASSELAPGYRVPELSHSLGPVAREVIHALRLDRAGLEFLTPDPSLTSFTADGRALVFHRDDVLTAASIHALSTRDASQWSEFKRTVHRVAGVIARLDRLPPPGVDGLSAREMWALLRTGRHARSLGRRDLIRLTRWMPMSIADLTSEWFETEPLRAAIAAHALFGNPAGPRSAGTGAMFLARAAADPVPVGSGVTVKGGPGALTAALAVIANEARVSVRSDSRVVRILVDDGRATGVVLENGDQLSAKAVIGAIAPATVFSDLVPAGDIPPTFLHRMRHIRSRGVTAKVNLALDSAPAFDALAGDPVPLRGRLLVAPELDYLERAFDATKYGEISEQPWLEISVPSVIDPALAPEGGHVMSVAVHFAPRTLRSQTWSEAKPALLAGVLRVLEHAAPGIANHIVGQDVLTPEDLETRWGFPGGHIFHGESAIDQMWAARPLLGWASYRTPIRGLYVGSAGTHPGGGLTGLPGWLAAETVRTDLRKNRA